MSLLKVKLLQLKKIKTSLYLLSISNPKKLSPLGNLLQSDSLKKAKASLKKLI
jgi:hypothetical protein